MATGVAYQNLLNTSNEGGGLGSEVYWAAVDCFELDTDGQIIGIKCVPDNPTTLEEGVCVDGAHTFQTGEGFIRLKSTKKSIINAESVGETGCKKYKINLEAQFKGSYKAQHATMKHMLNTPGILLVKDANCTNGFAYQLGCDCNYAEIETSNFTTGTNDGETGKGYTLSFEWYNDCVIFYDYKTNPIVVKP